MSPETSLRAETEATQAGLVQKFLAGRSLLAAEAAALEGILPAELLRTPPKPRYRQILETYADRLRCDVRNIKRLIGIGRSQADYPPFDFPAEFLAWWIRCMKRPPHDKILAFAKVAPEKEQPAATAAGPANAPAPAGRAAPAPGSSPAAIPFEFTGIGGFEASVRELRMTVAAAQARLRRAMNADPLDESVVASCNRAVREQLDLLRKSENDLFSFQRERGELVPRTEVREDWRTLLAALRQMRRRMGDNVVAALAEKGKFPPEFLTEVSLAITAERDREDQLLRGSKFWRADVPASSAAAA